jgi:tetratricopeptide (TPR) repeat protein
MKLILSILLLTFSSLTFAQGSDEKLANLYFDRGEYEKALPYFERIFERSNAKINFNRLYECYMQTGDDRSAEKLIKKQISRYPFDFEYSVMLGQFYEDQKDSDKAAKIYDRMIDDLPASANSVLQMYNAFRSSGKNEYAYKTLVQGQKILKNTYPLQLQFADYYGATGQTEKMLDSYLELLDKYPNYVTYVQNLLSRQIEFDVTNKEYNYLKENLLVRVQRQPNNNTYSSMVIWLFVQTKSFSAALTQVIAMDKREHGQGYRVYDMGMICMENKDYSNARKAFEYVRNIGSDTPLYYRAELALLNSRYTEITTTNTQDSSIIASALFDYKNTIQRLGVRNSTLGLVVELAHLEAYYDQNPQDAITRLNAALKTPGLTDMQTAELKMKLADILVLSGEVWDASLFYMQIDKDFKFEPIGQEAKYKNARIFYYDGEFEFAQSQLSILKEATTKLIANDAMDLSLLITENYGMDSNYIAMNWFAKGELMIEQHRYTEAFQYFDSIQKEYDYSGLSDNILMKKSQAMQQQGKWTEAVGYLEELMKFYSYDLLADDALFQLGDIHEKHLNQVEKAAEYYKKILFDYKGSLHANEARNRFRRLRGDTVEDDEI